MKGHQRTYREPVGGVKVKFTVGASLRPSPTARFARGEGSACGRLIGALVSLLSGDALTAFGGGLRSADFSSSSKRIIFFPNGFIQFCFPYEKRN